MGVFGNAYCAVCMMQPIQKGKSDIFAKIKS